MRSLPNRELDILFVIDDSASTADKQVRFVAAFPQMMDVLAQIDGGLPDLHIGVVTSDLGTSSANTAPGPAVGILGAGGCQGTGKDGALRKTTGMTDVFLSDIAAADGTRIKNYTGELRDAFGDLARVGDTGCGFEQHLAAMRRALVNPYNAGFLRPRANLAVVVLADEDDCSLAASVALGAESSILGPRDSFRCFRFGVQCNEPTSTTGAKTRCHAADRNPFVEDLAPFVTALLAAKPDARMLMTAAIVGDPTPVAVELGMPPAGGPPLPMLQHSCTFTTLRGTDFADPAVRLAEFVRAFPDRSSLTSICSADLSSPLQIVGESAKKLMGDACLDTSQLADSSPEAGVQPACEVADVRDTEPDATTVLPQCSSGAADCYDIVADTMACPTTSDHLRIRIRRSTAAPEDSWTHIRCQLGQ